MSPMFRIKRTISRSWMVTILLVLAFLLSVWNTSRSCVRRTAKTKIIPVLKIKQRNMMHLGVPTELPSKSDTSNDVMTEDDLLYENATRIDVRLLKKIYFDKVKELKKNKVWKKIDIRKSCMTDQEPDTVCLDTTCTSPLPPISSDDNFDSVFKPLRRVRDVGARLTAALGAGINVSAVTFITAVSSNHFLESQALIRNLHLKVFPRLRNFTFYLYDLGLEPEQRQQLTKFCKCEVRSYPFHVLPRRFTFLKGFTWKPILMQAHLPFTDILVWVDSSIRFRIGNLEPMFQEARSRGMIISNVRFSVSEHTSEKMFSYFGDHACAYSIYNEAEAGFQVVHNEVFVRNLFLKTWWACAIDPDCMASEFNEKQFHCSSKVRGYSKCHRFDQSAYILILAKLFRENIATFFVQKGKYHVVKRHHTENYFEDLEKKGHL